MYFDHRYMGNSSVSSNSNSSDMSFVPDVLRDPTFFRGQIAKHLPFREAISALHKVVTDDRRFQIQDNSEYKAYRAEQDRIERQELFRKNDELRAKRTRISSELDFAKRELTELMKGSASYYEAQQKYFDYLYEESYDLWFVLDPVITVHPDSLFFECFSRDESSYGKLSCSYEYFKNVGTFSCGTTNVDYSYELYDEFQKIRDYKDTMLEVDPSGFTVTTEHEDAFKEVKIDLPDSWVRGFLQVSAAMALPAQKVRFHPMDIYTFCHLLRQKKEKVGPRSIRFILKPNAPVTVVFDPWGIRYECARSQYFGSEHQEIRIWGRRRLHILERLIPIAKYFDLYLLGTGMPYFFIAELGGMQFTLGLSGWSGNSFSGSSNFDLLGARQKVSADTGKKVYTALKKVWVASAQDLAQQLDLTLETVLSALGDYCQAGRAIFDLTTGMYRARELSQEPLDDLIHGQVSPEEQKAGDYLLRQAIHSPTIQKNEQGTKISAQLLSKEGSIYKTTIAVDLDGQMIGKTARCSCYYFRKNRLNKGPCRHLIALRMFLQQQG